MENTHDLKPFLSREIAAVIFGERRAPPGALAFIDDAVEESFADWSRNRINGAIEALSEMRGALGDLTLNDFETPTGVSNDHDWQFLKHVLAECAAHLGCPRATDEDEDADETDECAFSESAEGVASTD